MQHDVIVIGAGLVGLATAWHLARGTPALRVLVIDKEAAVASHQSGRSSGVLHAGVYYDPASAKARLCRDGRVRMERFCTEEGLPWRRCGKVVVATEPAELPRLRQLHARACANGLDATLVGPERLAELEPEAAGLQALHVPETGVADFRAVARRLAEQIGAAGGEVRLGVEVVGLAQDGDAVVVQTTASEERAPRVVNAAGLFSDRLARAAGAHLDHRIVPFRGEYWRLSEAASARLRGHIYPVPDPDLPFLGVHLSPDVHGRYEAGPNAVLALAREGYTWRDVHLGDLAELAAWPGVWRLGARFGGVAVTEVLRSLSRARFAASVRRLAPFIRNDDLEPAPAGVRAQAVSRRGELVGDFVWRRSGGLIHLCNAPSPAATSCLALGEQLAREVTHA